MRARTVEQPGFMARLAQHSAKGTAQRTGSEDANFQGEALLLFSSP
jgi:hypothetical protein